MHVEQQSVVLNGHVNEVSFCKHHTNVHWTFGGRSFACKRIKHNGRAPLNSISSLHGSMLAKTGAFNGYSSVTCQSWAKGRSICLVSKPFPAISECAWNRGFIDKI